MSKINISVLPLILHFNKIPAQNLFSLHIWQNLALLCRSVPRRQPSAASYPETLLMCDKEVIEV